MVLPLNPSTDQPRHYRGVCVDQVAAPAGHAGRATLGPQRILRQRPARDLAGKKEHIKYEVLFGGRAKCPRNGLENRS